MFEMRCVELGARKNIYRTQIKIKNKANENLGQNDDLVLQ